jgi:hypothetical protein
MGMYCSFAALYVIDRFGMNMSLRNSVVNPPSKYNMSFNLATPASKRLVGIEAQAFHLFVLEL